VIETERRGSATWILIANPKVVNAVGTADLEALREAISEAARDDSVALIVLAGRGGNFCSGDNLKESAAMDRGAFRSLISAFQELAWAVENSPKPLAAFIEGYALGGGAEIALMCDFVVAERTATIGCPEVALGGMISNGSSAFLTQAIGLARASELVLLSERRRADDPHLSGLFNLVGSKDECLDWIGRATDRLASSAQSAVAGARRALRAPGRQVRLAALTEELMQAMDLYGSPAYAQSTKKFAHGETAHGSAASDSHR
jgi:enoyl-CoA hydratase/carnithine racemase